ncbi:MAG: asparagine synthase (glutamine-hydrolyzing) [Flavobacteriales bacterium]|nr:asparagine synthase (glutamine-hydrolyzing) [Flavobacteriales bacterium]
MCGINGIFGLDGIVDPSQVLGRMNKAIAHRGPDAEGVFADSMIVLGHRRLSIIDVSADGNQPFYSQDRQVVMVFNGEIYNYRELKNELSDYPFKTQSDSEVLMAAYLKWGVHCLSRLEGMFAFAIWNTAKQELFIARDRMGVKPLYIAQTEKSIVFSSEIRAIIQSGLVSKEMDKRSLVDYLRYQTVHAPSTILKQVQMLMPGHYMVIQDSEVKTEEYWNAAALVNYRSEGKSYEEVTADVRALMKASVKKRLVADVPFGAFLSGGIDSSVVVALMAEVSSEPVSTFTVTFDDQEFSEAQFAKTIAEKFSTRHTEIKLKPEDFLNDLPQAIQDMDHPSGDGPNTWIVSRATKQNGISMALSGIGGDELFAGYDVFKRLSGLSSKQYLQYFPMGLRKLAGFSYRKFKPGIASDKIDEFLRLEYFDLEHVYPLNRQVLKDVVIAQLLDQKKLPSRSVKEILISGIGTGTAGVSMHELSKISYAEMYSYLQNVLLRDADQMSMAHALEIREPFLDHHLIEYVLGVRNRYKYPDRPKKLLVDAMNDVLPKEIWDRPKMGFTLPWKNWMKNELKSFCEDGIQVLVKDEHFDAEEIRNWWNAFLKDDPRVSWSRVWHLVVLGHWINTNLK